MAGISTDTGSERGSDGPGARPATGPVAPAAARDGRGACCWAPTATPTAAAPATMSRTPATPATRARRLPDAPGREAYPLCGQDMTTRSPAIRRHSASPNAVVPPSVFPGVL